MLAENEYNAFQRKAFAAWNWNYHLYSKNQVSFLCVTNNLVWKTVLAISL